MAFTLKIELSSEMEEELRKSIDQKNPENVSRILSKALAPTIEMMFQKSSESIPEDQFERLTDALVTVMSDHIDSNTPILSDRVLSREAIYADHL